MNRWAVLISCALLAGVLSACREKAVTYDHDALFARANEDFYYAVWGDTVQITAIDAVAGHFDDSPTVVVTVSYRQDGEEKTYGLLYEIVDEETPVLMEGGAGVSAEALD